MTPLDIVLAVCLLLVAAVAWLSVELRRATSVWEALDVEAHRQTVASMTPLPTYDEHEAFDYVGLRHMAPGPEWTEDTEEEG